MGATWNQANEEAFIAQLGEHGARLKTPREKAQIVRGYLRALDKPRRWDGPVDVNRLARLAFNRMSELGPE